MPKSGKVTIVDIARMAGVSKSTVSLVLRRSPLIKSSTADKIRKVMEDTGYVYNRGAANLRRAQTDVVGMVINDLTNPFFAGLAVGIEKVFQAAGLIPLIANTAEDPVRQDTVFQTMLEQGVAGLIVCPARGTTSESFKSVIKAQIPTVLTMRNIVDSRLPAICPDNRRGGYEAVNHLVGEGHQRIAFIGGYEDMTAFQERAGGYADALAANGLTIDPALIVQEDISRDGGVRALDAVMALDNPPTAVQCFNDVVAFGFSLALRARGIEPGRDFSVMGFDDIAEAKHFVPPLSTVSVDCFEMGGRAAHTILGMLRGEAPNTTNEPGAVHLTLRGTTQHQSSIKAAI